MSDLMALALEKREQYRPKKAGRKTWLDKLRDRDPDMVKSIVELVDNWRTDEELRRAYPNKMRLCDFIADLPAVNVERQVICRALFRDDD